MENELSRCHHEGFLKQIQLQQHIDSIADAILIIFPEKLSQYHIANCYSGYNLVFNISV